MVVGLATLDLHLHDAASLKDKRRVVKSVTARVRSRFNVAVAEVGNHDTPATATLGVACISTESGHAHAVLEKVVRFVEAERLDAVLGHYGIEMR